ncbi:MAG: rod shape-determining protein RodA [Hydrogenophaga sp.]|uniref:rod shape-determining protein RodA n=1 Tax=Hydrogenophaga sp. TaxID=1904254 RepID=UPI0027570427|nr:rod shape-determining protein RodA [Hydrogenophaga sp.]MDP2418704.1 rod shape-determining protein RodA [Hydrogenophaga sp.]MDZ4189387.1 rod shape-determining protein RodA [Hydrogenophaga sp.]
MSTAFDKPNPLQRIAPIFQGFDGPLVLAVLLLAGLGLITMYSVGFDHGTRFTTHGRNMLLAAGVLFLVAQVPPQRLLAVAVPMYVLGVLLLLGVELFGIEKKGAQRWLNMGVVIQPSELLKIAMPLMLAWWFQRREGQLKSLDFAVAGLLLAVPAVLILKQPDLGTTLLVVASGLFVIFFAGLSWKLIIPPMLVGAVGIIVLIVMEPQWCAPDVDWKVLREYQRQRVCTLLDPSKDPLGKGFHIIQGMIAIGSGGVWGKGFMQGTQTHLEFIPERTTDFIYAAFSEEFGLMGVLGLMAIFIFLVVRGLMIALEAPTLFSRLLAGALTLNIFVYAFVNMGMVSGILPVVGVPLPFVSYGGTAMITLGVGLGMLMSIAKSKRLMQS